MMDENGLLAALGHDTVVMHLLPQLEFAELASLRQASKKMKQLVDGSNKSHTARYAHFFGKDAYIPEWTNWENACRARENANLCFGNVKSISLDQQLSAVSCPLQRSRSNCSLFDSVKTAIVINGTAVVLTSRGRLLTCALATKGEYKPVSGTEDLSIKGLWDCGRGTFMSIDDQKMIYQHSSPDFTGQPYYRWPYPNLPRQLCTIDGKTIALADQVGLVAFSEDFPCVPRATGHWAISNTALIEEVISTRNGLVVVENGKCGIIKVLDGDFEAVEQLVAVNSRLTGNERILHLNGAPQAAVFAASTSHGSLIGMDQSISDDSAAKAVSVNASAAFLWTRSSLTVLSNEGILGSVQADIVEFMLESEPRSPKMLVNEYNVASFASDGTDMLAIRLPHQASHVSADYRT